MTLTANFNLGPIDAERRYLGHFRELLAAGFLHQRVTVDTSRTAARVSARLPVRLNASLVAAEAGLVLYFGRFTGILAKRDHPTDSLAAARCHVIAARAMTIFARSFFRLVARVVQEYFAHQGCRKFFELGRVASLTNFVAHISGRSGFRRVSCGGPNP